MFALHVTLFAATVALSCAAACVSILSLHSDRDAHERAAKRLFYAVLALFCATGLSRVLCMPGGGLVRMITGIWGYFYLLAAALLAMLLYLRFGRWKNHWKAMSPVGLLFVAVILALSAPFVASQRAMRADLVHGLLPFHVALTVAGELFFFFCFIGALLYIVMARQLKKKGSMKFIYRLPNLEAIERFNAWSIRRALVFLSAGLLVGVVQLWISYGAVFLFSPKEIVIYLSWVCIAALFLAQRYRVVGSYALSRVTLVCFAVIMTVFMATNIAVKTGFHSFR
jgi:hypothetical protein